MTSCHRLNTKLSLFFGQNARAHYSKTERTLGSMAKNSFIQAELTSSSHLLHQSDRRNTQMRSFTNIPLSSFLSGRSESSTENSSSNPKAESAPVYDNNCSKRCRDEDESEAHNGHVSHSAIPIPVQPNLHSPKRNRLNAYHAPRIVPKSFTSTMGSLAAGGGGHEKSGLRVHNRRQLSGSKLDEYLGDHDSMDVDTTEAKPRSMSF